MSKTNKSALVNESIVRRWGKLANMDKLTESFMDTNEDLFEEEEEEELGMDEPAADAEPEMDMGEKDAAPEDQEAVERIVSAVVDAISAETGVDIEVEGEAGDAAISDEDPAMRGEEDPAMRGEDPAMRGDDHPAMRGDKMHEETVTETEAKDDDKDKDEDDDEDKKMKKEELDLEVFDDEALTEAVLKRVVERLLKRNK